VFELLRYQRRDQIVTLCAFDLLPINGDDLRSQPIEDRKRRLSGLLRLPHQGIALNEHFEDDGAAVYRAACQLGCEGIVSKRLGSPYRAGRSPHWIKAKNPNAPAVKREAEEWSS
jgi:bifunctional non-homologous end joining protein LigD